MVKMEIYSDPEDQQISKMNEASLLAYKVRKAGHRERLGFGKFKLSSGSGTKVFPPESKKIAFGTGSFFVPPLRCSNEALAAPNFFPSESLLSNGKKADVEPEDSAATNKLQRRQPPGGSA
jgi:hypothetical protein